MPKQANVTDTANIESKGDMDDFLRLTLLFLGRRSSLHPGLLQNT